jgi:hypothetical protein
MVGGLNGIYGVDLTNDFKYFAYNCTGYYNDYKGTSKNLQGVK